MRAIQERLGIEAQQLEALRESALAEQVGEIVARLCSCGTRAAPSGDLRAKRNAISASLRAAWGSQADRLRSAAAGLTDFIAERYEARRHRLLAELRLFTGSNALLFVATFAMAAFSSAWARTLLVPTGLLTITTAVSSYVYLFEQDWLHTILFESYVGAAYLAYVAVVFAMLTDVALNKARVTWAILESLPSALVPPC